MNTCVLDNLYGLEETLQYGQQETRIAKMAEQTGPDIWRRSTAH